VGLRAAAAFAWLAPFAALAALLLANGANCWLFPRTPCDAAVSLAFFVRYWRAVTFEQMFRCLLVAVPALGALLRGARSPPGRGWPTGPASRE
jgi:hypothetical protein